MNLSLIRRASCCLLNRAGRMTIGLFLVTTIAVISGGCERLNVQRAAIYVEDNLIAEVRDSGARSIEHVVVTRENPRIHGTVALPTELELRTSHGVIEVCCTHSQVVASEAIFSDPPDRVGWEYLSITEPSTLRRSDGSFVIYSWTTEVASLPAGRTVELSLVVDGTEQVAGQVSLAPDVIVLPVHIIVFRNPERGVPEELSFPAVRAWIDGNWPSISLVTTSPPRRTAVQTWPAPVYEDSYEFVDPIWNAAKIQFRFESYLVWDDAELEEQILDQSIRVWRPAAVDARLRGMGKDGIRVYIGRNSANYDRGETGVVKGDTLNGGCRAPRDESSIILVFETVDDFPVANSKRVLAHELGHFLGLDHTIDEGACGQDLVRDLSPGTPNLMWTGAGGSTLTEAQIRRARAVACEYLVRWGSPSPACSQ